LLSKVDEANLKRAHRKGSWTFDVLSAFHETPGADVLISAIKSRSKMNMSDFESLLREQTIREWRDLDQTHPHDAYTSSRVMRTYHTHFGVPIGSQTGWWDDQKRAVKPTLPSYLRHNIPNHLSRTLLSRREYAADKVASWQQSVCGEPGDAQCVAKLVASTHPPDTHHRIGLALRCTHQRVDTPAAPEATLLQLCPALAATFSLPLG